MGRFKGENTKVTAAKQKKEAVKAEKSAKMVAEKEAQEALEWSTGAKKAGKKDLQAAKKAEKLGKKAEAAAILQQEEKELGKHKPLKPIKATGEEKKALKKSAKIEAYSTEETKKKEVEEFAATNIDDALDLLSITTSGKNSMNKSAAISQTATLDRHPERRHKAAFAAYEARELPVLKEENKGLRLTQIKQIMWKNWQKSPENPFNQASLALDASKEEERAFIEAQRLEIENRLKMQ